jgi:lactate permease
VDGGVERAGFRVCRGARGLRHAGEARRDVDDLRAAFGIFPISWICFGSILLYRLAVDTGKFEIIKDSVGGLTNDRRLQAMFVAFRSALHRGAAGFGAPVAISGAMLAGLGFLTVLRSRIRLLGNTTPVAFGSLVP